MNTYEEVVNLALRRSLFYPASEIYPSAPAGMYDYGPFGAAIKRKIVETWRKYLVQQENFLEIDGALIMPEEVFKASGHLGNFNDPMTQCAKCNTVHRADKLLEEVSRETFREAMPVNELTAGLRKHKVKCPKCKGELSDVRQFNMMIKSEIGAVTKTPTYLRMETCQSIFLDWDRLVKTMRIKLPKGVAQTGKVFRNEISPRQTLLRLVELHQMEAEIFFDPEEINTIEKWNDVKDYKVNVMSVGKKNHESITAEKLVKDKIVSGKLIAYYLARTQQFFEKLGIQKMRFRELDETERAFYAKEAWDFEVETSLGWLELAANNYRTDYDLKRHGEGSKKDLSFLREDGSKFIPHVWEISIGLDRSFYTAIELSFKKQGLINQDQSTPSPKVEGERTWLSLPTHLAPLCAGVFPLLSNKPELVKKAKEVCEELHDCYEVMYDESGSIGKRYARLDEIGVPFCITIDFDSLTKNDVTIRARDSAAQKRVKISELKDVMYELVTGKMTI